MESSQMKVFVVMQIEADLSYYQKENHDPEACVEICTPVRVFLKKADAEKYKNDNSTSGCFYEVYEMKVRESYE